VASAVAAAHLGNEAVTWMTFAEPLQKTWCFVTSGPKPAIEQILLRALTA